MSDGDLSSRQLERRIDEVEVTMDRRVDKVSTDLHALIVEVRTSTDRRITLMEQSATTLSQNMKDINTSIRWLAITVGGSLLTAFMKFALSGGLHATGIQ